MFIVTQEKELLNSEHVVKFITIKNSDDYQRPSKLFAILKEYSDVEIYQGTQEKVETAMDNLIEAFMSNATLIDYSQQGGTI